MGMSLTKRGPIISSLVIGAFIAILNETLMTMLKGLNEPNTALVSTSKCADFQIAASISYFCYRWSDCPRLIFFSKTNSSSRKFFDRSCYQINEHASVLVYLYRRKTFPTVCFVFNFSFSKLTCAIQDFFAA